jgi:hypothetical protein
MRNNENPRFLGRMLTALGGALKRGILGKSSNDYLKQFTGSNEYWERAIAAQLGWPRNQSPKPDPNRFPGTGTAVMRARPTVEDNGGHSSAPEFEPVHGWTKRQFDDYLARNPGYRSTYETELQNRCYAADPEVNGSSLDWFKEK